MHIVIAEDLLLLRDGIVRLLTDTGHTVIAAVDTAPALLAAVTEHRPDLSIVDVRLPPGFRDEGLRAALTLRASEGTPGCSSSPSTSNGRTPWNCSPTVGAVSVTYSRTA